MLSEKYVSPLASQTKLKCSQQQQQNSINHTHNPVIAFDSCNKLKKKKKGHKIEFIFKKEKKQ